MAATSPYTQNDYTAVSNFRPYELPINDIFRAISAQNQFWDAGAAKVKAYHDTALNLKLSLEPNKAIRDKYIQDAEKQLTKLSSMDLADPEVQRKGFALFKPLFQDEGIMYDDLTTRHYEKVRNDAMMYRSKDNGKGYSDINFQYSMTGYNEFLNSQDRMAGKSFYENRKEYTPFYDYTDDFSQALKECKPSSIETTSPSYGKNNSMTGYMLESATKGLSAAQVNNCLESGLSTNGKRQLQIEGAVAYRGNIGTLGSDAASFLSGVSGNYSTQLQQLAGQKALILGKKDISDKDKAAMIAALDEQSTALSQELDRTNNSIKKINSGDLTDVQNNFENYAGTVYSYKKLYKKALASAFEETKNNYKADPIQLNHIKFEQQKYLNQMDFSFDVSLEEMKQQHEQNMKLLDLMYGGSGSKSSTGNGQDVTFNPLTGQYTINPAIGKLTNPSLTDEPAEDDKIYQELTNKVESFNQMKSTNDTELYNSFVARAERDTAFRESLLKGFNYGTTDDEWARFKGEHGSNKFQGKNGEMQGIQDSPWFQAYSAETIKLPNGATIARGDNDEIIDKWAQSDMRVKIGINGINSRISLAEKQVAEELGLTKQGVTSPEDIITSNVAKMKPINIDGRSITAMDMKNALEGKPSSIVARRFPQGEGQEDFIEFYTNDGVRLNRNDHKYDALYKLSANVKDKVKDVGSDIRKKRAEVYNRLGFDREPWFQTLSGDKGPIVEAIKTALPVDKNGKQQDVRIIGQDFAGGIQFTYPGASQSDIDKIISTRQGTTVEFKDGIFTMRGTNYNVIPQAINDPILKEAAYQLTVIGETSAFIKTEAGAKVQNADIKVPIMISGKQKTMTIETYKVDGQPQYRCFVEGATDTRPKFTANNAYDLFTQIANSPLEFKKPIK